MSKSKLVMAHAMRKAAKKKLASGGSVKSGSKDMNYAKGGKVESAKSEKRPMPDNRYNDSKEASRNSGDKPAKNDSWADNITVKQAQKPSVTKLSQPKIIGSDAFSVRNMNMRDDENDLGDSIHPETDRRQPIKRDDEYDAKKMGKGPDMASQHNNKKAPYNKEIEDQYAQDMAAAEMKKVQSYAEGGKVDTKTATGGAKTGGAKTGGAKTSTTGNKTKTGGSNPGGASTGGAGTVTITTRDLGSKGINVSNVGGKTAAKNHGGMDPGDEDDDGKALMAQGGRMEPRDNHEELIERDDEAHLQSEEAPSEDEGSEEAHSLNEDDEMGHNSGRIDMEDEHSNGRKPYAQGGNVDMHKEMDDQPDDEAQMEHAASIAAAIMAKRAHKQFMAIGGIASKDSIDSDDSSQVDLSRNADEDANEEDQLSFNALRKENYSESAGLKKLDQPSDSNETNDPREDESENKHDKSIVSKIMKKRKSSPITK